MILFYIIVSFFASIGFTTTIYITIKLINHKNKNKMENTNENENQETVPTEKELIENSNSATEKNEHEFKVDQEIEYTLKNEDKETHNLHGAKTIRATIKSIEGDKFTISIKSFENKVVGAHTDEENNEIGKKHESVEKDGIEISNVSLDDIKAV